MSKIPDPAVLQWKGNAAMFLRRAIAELWEDFA